MIVVSDIPKCTADNMGDNPFCIPPDYNKVMILFLIAKLLRQSVTL